MSEDREYKKLVFDTAVPVTVTLAFDQPKERDGEYGKYYNYGCKKEGGVYPFFIASPELHRQIQELGKKQNDTFTITKIKKTDPNTRKDVTMWEISNPDGSTSAPAQKTGGQQSSGATHTPFIDEKDISIKHQCMLKCASFVVAQMFTKEDFISEKEEGSKYVDSKKISQRISEIAWELYPRHEYAVKKFIEREEELAREEKQRKEEEKEKSDPVEQEEDNFISSPEGGGDDPFSALDGSVPF